MNHTFTSFTSSSFSSTFRRNLTIIATISAISVVGLPLGILLFIIVLTFKNVECPACKKKVASLKGVQAFTCYYCQSIIAKKDNHWRVVTEGK